jgi:CelD/BcsL family acetyltransferase involved in cellulose biosynthesis
MNGFAQYFEDTMSGKLQIAGRVRGALRSIVPAALKIAHPREPLPPVEQGGFTAQCLRDWPANDNFQRQYLDLMQRTASATVFNSLAWQTAVVNEFVPAGQFRLIAVSRDQQLVGLLPLGFNTASMLETPGKWLTDYLDPLIDSELATDVWKIILHLLNKLWDWSIGGLQLHHVRGDSNLRRILPEIAPEFGFEYSDAAVSAAPFIVLPKTWDQYLAALDAHQRKEIKRKLRNAETKASLRWLTLKTESEIAPALDRALAAMRQAESEKADFTDEILVGFLRRLAPALCRQGDFFINELWLEEKPAAWLLCLRSERGPMIYNTSYDFAARQWSPGVLCFSRAIQDAITAGAPIFNLLRGAEEYKKRLGAQDLELFKVQLLPA